MTSLVRRTKIPVNILIANLLIPFSGFYCNRFVDPVYVVFSLSMFLCLFYIVLRGKVFIDSTILLVAGFVGYLLVIRKKLCHCV